MDATPLYRLICPPAAALFRLLWRVQIEGSESIPPSGSCVLAGNHTSNLDCALLIASTSRGIRFLAKDELVKGIGKHFFLAMGIIPVNRREKDKTALASAVRVLNGGGVIGIFPEGTTNRTVAPLLPFKIGAVKMAHDTASPVVPFTISGKYRLLRRSVKITFGTPYHIGLTLDAENRRLMQTVAEKLNNR